MKQFYNSKFYKARTDSLHSAQIIIPILKEFIDFNSVIDVGCGTGEFLSIFKKLLGINDICGLDGEWVEQGMLRIDKDKFIATNLERDFCINRTFDLVVCLEVAEHLSKKNAENFVYNLTRLGKIIFFSAAIPGQGGTNHINEQWPDYWIDLFQKYNYTCYDSIRPRIWNNDLVSL